MAERSRFLPAIVEGAKKEGKVVVRGSIRPKDWQKFIAPFKEKVPFVEIEYTSAPFRRRVRKTVTEFRAGRVSADIVTGIMGAIPEFAKLDMLANISDLPTYGMYGSQLKDKDGRWIARQTLFWGVAYRTDRVKKEEVDTWDDLLKPEWGQRLATANKPHLLPHILWADWGPEKAKAWLKKFFATGLQLRKEGSGAVANLLAAGEYDVLFTVHGRAIRRLANKGSPVAWTFHERTRLSVSFLYVRDQTGAESQRRAAPADLLDQQGRAVEPVQGGRHAAGAS